MQVQGRLAFSENDEFLVAEWDANPDERLLAEAGDQEVAELEAAEHLVPSVVSCVTCKQTVNGIRTKRQTNQDQILHPDHTSTSST